MHRRASACAAAVALAWALSTVLRREESALSRESATSSEQQLLEPPHTHHHTFDTGQCPTKEAFASEAVRGEAIRKLCARLGICEVDAPPPVRPQTLDLAFFQDLSRRGGGGMPRAQCGALFDCEAEALLDWPGTLRPPPCDFPNEYKAEFLMNGGIDDTNETIVDFFCFNQIYAGSESEYSTWTVESIEGMRAAADSQSLEGSYGYEETRPLHDLLLKVKEGIIGKHVLVVGTEVPWLEAMLLSIGARHVTTVEYGRIHTNHTQLSSLLPSELARRFFLEEPPLLQFDAAVTYSSVEHSGMGRYGDALNPFGDVFALARIMCLVKPGGLVAVGVPSRLDDGFTWNAHRWYGWQRWPLLLRGLHVVGYHHPCVGCYHGVVVGFTPAHA